MKKLILVLLIFSACPLCPLAQIIKKHASAETEWGIDGKTRDESVSQYVFYTSKKTDRTVGLAALSHYFYVHPAVNRGEAGLGPRLQFKRASIDLYVGFTTDKKILAAQIAAIQLPKDFDILAISDVKVSTAAGSSNTWFRKVSIGRGFGYLRWEDFRVAGTGTVFGRLGIEARLACSKRVSIFLYPFYDYKNSNIGLQGGLRLILF